MLLALDILALDTIALGNLEELPLNLPGLHTVTHAFLLIGQLDILPRLDFEKNHALHFVPAELPPRCGLHDGRPLALNILYQLA
jgi:hypothetical protein